MTEEAGKETAKSNQDSPRIRYVEDLMSGGKCILDIGCNTGWFLDLVKCDRKIGLDWDSSFEDIVTSKGHEFIQAHSWDIDLLFPENSFDRIFCGQLIAHMRPDLVETTLKAVYKVLAPGGLFILTTVVGPAFLAGMYWEKNRKVLYQEMSWFHVHEWEPTDLLLLFKDVGFQVYGIHIMHQEDEDSATYKSNRYVQIIMATKGVKDFKYKWIDANNEQGVVISDKI